MSNEPKQALDSILETDFTTRDGLTIHPLTIGRYALLELVESPFLGYCEFSIANTIPSVYVMSQPIAEIAGYDSKTIKELKAKAIEWADKTDMKDFGSAIDLISRRMAIANDAAPQGTSDDDSSAKDKTKSIKKKV